MSKQNLDLQFTPDGRFAIYSYPVGEPSAIPFAMFEGWPEVEHFMTDQMTLLLDVVLDYREVLVKKRVSKPLELTGDAIGAIKERSTSRSDLLAKN